MPQYPQLPRSVCAEGWDCETVGIMKQHFGFQDKFYLKDQGQLSFKMMAILTKVFYTSGPNLVILAWTVDELWCGQAQNGLNFYFTLKVKVNGPTKQ